MFMPFCGVGLPMEWLPPAWCPKVVVIDIDGTITDGEKHLSMQAVESIRRLEGGDSRRARHGQRSADHLRLVEVSRTQRPDVLRKRWCALASFVEGTHASCNG